MLLGARQYTWPGGAKLPYDAEVEYLESTGTQYIDTGVVMANRIIEAVYRIAISDITTTTPQLIIGSYFDTSSLPKFQFYYQGNGWRDVDTTHSRTTLSSGAGVGGSITVGTQYELMSKTVYRQNISTSPIFFFARNNQRGAQLFCHGLRAYYLKIIADGTLVRDFIPVRVGSGANAVGYMYDRVSGELFGNAGTGAFVIGPDASAANEGV